MAFFAKRKRDNAVVGTTEATGKAEYRCLECGEPMGVWDSFETSNGVFVSRHFKHLGDLGGCSGGESARHKQMKAIALHKLQWEFDVAAAGLEETIGAHTADAYVRFTDGHHRYGTGFAVEVQYRNEGKDIEAVTENYLDHQFSVLWLWEEQFEGKDVDLFGGRVETVWPECVPPAREWHRPKHGYRQIRSRWVEAFDEGLPSSGAPATLPPEWCDEAALDLWRGQRWGDLFPDTLFYRADSPHDVVHRAEYAAEKHRVFDVIRGLDLGPINSLQVTLPPEVCDEAALDLWRSQPWEALFPAVTEEADGDGRVEYQADVYIEEVRDSLDEPTVELTYLPWSRERLWKWYQVGLDEEEPVYQRLPAPSEWGGTFEFTVEPETPTLTVRFPPDLLASLEADLYEVWDTFYHASYDTVIHLSEANADRRCDDCGGAADFYLRSEGVDSRFSCRECTCL